MTALAEALAAIVGGEHAHAGGTPAAAAYATDATAYRGLRGTPDAVALPGTAEEVAAVVRWCYHHDVVIVPRGGGSGLAGGAVPVTGGVVVSTERLRRVRALAPERWRMTVEAGVSTAHVQRLARESGLVYPPDPGAPEQSLIGGNVATNAGGPHAFKYGATGSWVTGVEAVMAPGELVRVGGTVRKDVAGYDLKSLLVGSEGTLGIVTAVTLRLLPAPEACLPLVVFFDEVARGCAAVTEVVGSGFQPAALEFLDATALAAVARAYPGTVPDGAAYVLIAEVDGRAADAAAQRDELVDLLRDGALAVDEPPTQALWRWRDGVSPTVAGLRGGKVSEDIAVPIDRLAEAIARIGAIAAAHGLEACTWGHAGDGNVHASLLIDPRDGDQLVRAERAAQQLFALAIALGGSVTGEHGIGWLKRGQLARQWPPAAVALHERIKQTLDPKGLLNPGKKAARVRS